MINWVNLFKRKIHASDVVFDDGVDAETEHQKRKLCMVSGTVIKVCGGADSIPMHNWEEVQSLFQSVHGFIPEKAHEMGIAFTNGDGAAQMAHINGATITGSQIYAVFDRAVSGAMRINFAYFYNYFNE